MFSKADLDSFYNCTGRIVQLQRSVCSVCRGSDDHLHRHMQYDTIVLRPYKTCFSQDYFSLSIVTDLFVGRRKSQINAPMLAVDKNIEISLGEQSAWNKRGIPTVRVDSMQEAIKKLAKDSFYFVAINADNIDYIPTLRIMRNTTNRPIFLITTHYIHKNEIEARKHGADEFIQSHNTGFDHIELALILLQKYSNKNSSKTDCITLGDLCVFPSLRQVSYKNTEILLTGAEFDLLQYLIKRPGCVLSHQQIYNGIYYDMGESSVDVVNAICCLVGRLRRKLSIIPDIKNSIQTVRGFGYKLIQSEANQNNL